MKQNPDPGMHTTLDEGTIAAVAEFADDRTALEDALKDELLGEVVIEVDILVKFGVATFEDGLKAFVVLDGYIVVDVEET